MRSWHGLFAIAFLWPASVDAQLHQLAARGDAITCEPTECVDEGTPCRYGPDIGTCAALIPGAPICLGVGHDAEPYCCLDPDAAQCPTGTACHLIEGETFGLCLGPGNPAPVCADEPAMIHLLRCRDYDYLVTYDWGHGDCDGDGTQNDADPEPCSGTPVCACDPDVEKAPDGTYQIDLADIGVIASCRNDSSPPECLAADVNCDGTVDYCDVAVVEEFIGRGYTQPEHFLCESVRCGACDTPTEGCVQTSETYCTVNLSGTYRGDARSCSRPSDGGSGDGATRDSATGDSGSRRDTGSSSGTSFRGAGGCACRAAGARDLPGGGLLAVAVAIWWWRRLRKTA